MLVALDWFSRTIKFDGPDQLWRDKAIDGADMMSLQACSIFQRQWAHSLKHSHTPQTLLAEPHSSATPG